MSVLMLSHKILVNMNVACQKEVRATILMSEIYYHVPESERRDEPEREKLLPLIKADNENKWLDMSEFTKLLEVLNVKPDEQYYEFLVEYLQENSEYLNAPEKVKDEFVKTDSNLDGVISKVCDFLRLLFVHNPKLIKFGYTIINNVCNKIQGELIATLHNHRPGYYNDARLNHRFSRVDRNKDGKISFNEYLFLSNLKHPNRK